MKNTFHIKHFDDYHEIRSKTFKSIELGCFPTKDGFGYNRYFGLFFKGRKPSLQKVLSSLQKKIPLNTVSIHYRTKEEIPEVTLEDLEYEVKRALSDPEFVRYPDT